MNCENIFFDCATIINLIIGAIIGFGLSYLAAYLFESFTNKRNQSKLLEKYKFLESKNDEFDWQHWNIVNGKIANNPIPSFMKMKYLSGKTFSFDWIERKDGSIEGNGKIIFEDEVYGYMHFFSINTIHYNRRNIFYKRFIHQEINYDAIFVDANDQGYKYVLMRKV